MKILENKDLGNASGGTGEIVVYQPDEITRLEVRLKDETVWLNRQQIAQLFGRDVKTIGKHINNALNEELSDIPTVANFAIVQEEGQRWVTRYIEHYNLDMIISIGYRVKSQKGVLFRRWANVVLKDYLMKGIIINQRISSLERRIEDKFIQFDQKLYEHEKKIEFFIQSSLPPKQGIFFDGQIYDAYSFVAQLVRSAKRRIVLIDNYIDDTVLTLLAKREAGVEAVIYTGMISKQLQLDIDKHNAQYPPVEVRIFSKAHDRFLIIDEKVYLVGASIKDLGKKWFGFTLMENTEAEELLGRM
ncbi:MAG: DNA-binding protein [Bacteroidales bacterium]|nr:DNA-binding protein [Bacteroidales bacterium]